MQAAATAVGAISGDRPGRAAVRPLAGRCRRAQVVHVITRLDLGGAQQNTLYSAAHHDRSRFRVGLIAGAGGLLDDEARALRDVSTRLVNWLPHAISPGRDLVAAVRLARALRGVDVVHTHSSKAGIVGRLSAALAGVPAIVHTVHGWSFNETQPASTRALYVALERWAATVSSRLIVVAARDRERGLAAGIGRPSSYELIRSGIDIAAFRRVAGSREAARARLGLSADETLVGSVACLKPQKAPLDLVETMARLAARPGLRMAIAGDGEQRDAVERRIRELGLERRVRLLGWRRDVASLLHAMDVFLLTSTHEGLPRAVLQAMAAGTPVVATAVDGTPEVVHDGRTGLLIPPGEPAAAAAAVERMLDTPGLAARCAEGARRMLDREFDIREMVRRLDRTYLSLTERIDARRSVR